MPIGAAGNPFFCDFMHPADTPVAQTHQVRAKLREREIQKSSLEIDFNGKFNRTLNPRFRDMVMRGALFTTSCLILPGTGVNKPDFKWQWAGIVIGLFGRKGAPIYYRG